jgi:hypothetical protein
MVSNSDEEKEARLRAIRSAPTIDPDPPFDARANSLRIFNKPFWFLETVLHWISFRSKETIVERWARSIADDYRRRRWYGPPFASKQPPGEELKDALQSGTLPTVLNGKHLPAVTWSHLEIDPGSRVGKFFVGEFFEDAKAEREVVLTLWPPRDEDAPNQQKPKNRRGRAHGYDWDGAKLKFLELMKDNDEFISGDKDWNCQACAEREILKWFLEKRGQTPVESTVRVHVSDWLKEWRKMKAEEADKNEN